MEWHKTDISEVVLEFGTDINVGRTNKDPKVKRNAENMIFGYIRAHEMYVTEIKGKNERILIYMKPDANIDPTKIPELLGAFPKKLNFVAKGNPYFVYKYKKMDLIEKDAEQLLSLTETLLEKMKEMLLS